MTPDLWSGSDAISASGGFDYIEPSIPPELLSFPPLGPLVPTREIRPSGASLTLLSGAHTIYAPSGGGSTAVPAILIYINGTLRSNKVSIARGLSINMALGQNSTATFSVISTDGTFRPEIDQEVVIVDSSDGSRLFGGDIESPGEQHEDGTSIIWTDVKAAGYGKRLDSRVFAAYYDTTFIWSIRTLIVDWLWNHIPDIGLSLGFGPGGDNFTTDIVLPWDTATNHLRRLLEPQGLDFWVDEYGAIHTMSKTSGHASAPFNLFDGSDNWDSNTMTVTRERGPYANRIILIPDMREPGFWNDTFLGNEGAGGSTTPQFYITKYRLMEKPTILVDGVTQRVGEYWSARVGNDFVYAPEGFGVTATGTATYGGANVIEIIYPSPIQPVIIAEDEAEIASYGRTVDAIVQVRDVTDRARLLEIAAGELSRRMVRPYYVEYRTQEQGLRPGQIQTISTTQPLVPNISFLIDSVSGTFEPRANGGIFRWTVRAGNTPVQAINSGVRRNQRIRELLMKPQDRHRVTVTFDIAADPYPGYTGNTGAINTGKLPLDRQLDKPGYLKEVRLRFERSGTQVATAQIDVRINGTTVFANDEYVEYAPSVTSGDTVKKFNFSSVPFAVVAGDIVTVWLITGDAALRNGKGEIEIQG